MTNNLPGKPFDLEAAKRGEPMLVFYPKSRNPIDTTPITAWGRIELVTGGLLDNVFYADTIYFFADDSGESRDGYQVVRMAPKKRTIWVAIFVGRFGGVYCDQCTYATEADARIKHPDDFWSVFPHEITE